MILFLIVFKTQLLKTKRESVLSTPELSRHGQIEELEIGTLVSAIEMRSMQKHTIFTKRQKIKNKLDVACLVLP